MKRFQNYVFNQNFVIVIDFCDNNDNFQKIYQCIHHDIETKNWKKLDDHVDIVKKFTNRQREMTKIKSLNCKWKLFFNYKRVNIKQKKSKI